MTSYTKSTDFAVKDVLLTGNPNKLVKGSEVDVEFNNMELADLTNIKKTGTTGSAALPVGTTAQRDAAPAVGYTRVNTTTGTLEWWDGTIWTSANGGDAYDTEVFTATAGQTVITTASNYTVGSSTLMVWVNGLLVNKTTDYTETTTNSFTFNSGLTVGDEVVAQIWRTNIATSGDAGTMSYSPAGTGAVATTVQSKLRESVSAADFTGYDSTGVIDSHAAITAALAAHDDVLITGTPLIASTLVIPAHKKIRFLGGRGNTTASYPPSYIIKKSTMTTTGIEMSACSEIEGGGLVCQAGNTGDGIALIGNSARLTDAYVWGAGNDGIRIGIDAEGGNFNSCAIDNCTTQYNGRYGLYIHDGKAAVGPDANAITVTQLFSRGNGVDGIRLGHCWWVTLINCLSDLNTGYGLYLSGTVNGTNAECRWACIVGGDYLESNTAGWIYDDSYFSTFVSSYTAQIPINAISHPGTPGSGLRSWIGGSSDPGGSALQGANINTYPLYINGVPITFPTTTPTNGVTTSNSISTYEEGTWTPTIVGSTTAGAGTYTTQTGKWTRIGRQVTVVGIVVWTAHTGTGTIRIGGLPYKQANDGLEYTGMTDYTTLTVPANSIPYIVSTSNQTYLQVWSMPVAGAAPAALAIDVAAGLYFNITYFA